MDGGSFYGKAESMCIAKNDLILLFKDSIRTYYVLYMFLYRVLIAQQDNTLHKLHTLFCYSSLSNPFLTWDLM